MNNQIIYCERTEKGASNIPAIQVAIMSFPIGKRLEVLVRAKSHRSDKQHRYFHACISILSKELGYTSEEMKSIVKMKFLKREKVNEQTGEIFEYLLETHKLSKEDFSEFKNNFMNWSAQLGVILPLPDEQLTAFK